MFVVSYHTLHGNFMEFMGAWVLDCVQKSYFCYSFRFLIIYFFRYFFLCPFFLSKII